jgi:hypothetical protein
MPRRRAAAEPMRICFHKTEGIADATLTVRGRADLDSLRGVIGPRWWDPALTADAFDAIAAGLRDAALEWDRVAPGSALVRTWRGGERRIAAS